jgi:hypothetical protein
MSFRIWGKNDRYIFLIINGPYFYIMLTPQDVAQALSTTRVEFAKIFWQAQTLVPIPVASRIEFEAIAATEANDVKAFEVALVFAQQNGFFLFIIILAVNTGLEKGLLAGFLIKQITDGNAQLHAIANPPAGFIEPLLFSKGVIKFSKMTGKVLINAAAMGTGILVGPNLFLTAWHVISDLFDQTAGAGGEIVWKEKQQLPTLQVEFNSILDMVNGAVQSSGTTIINAHKDWLVTYSTCHNLELSGKLPQNLSDLNLFNDYAIIRLSKTIGLERRWIEPDKRAKLPPGKANIVLLQHPQGFPLKMDYSSVVDLTPPDPAIPAMRFLHGLNAVGGSSGGPCFDKEFSLIGLHQGSWPQPVNGNITNRGIPISKIIEHYSAKFTALPLPDPSDCPVWCLDKKSFQPFIGYDDFQLDMWKSAMTGNKRLITTSGTDQSGKSYLMELVFSILSDGDHLKITLEGEGIAKKTALELAKKICSDAGADVPDFASLTAFNSTPFAWLKGEIVTKLITALESKRNKRNVWLCIKNLNKVNIEGEHASDFLFLLYESAVQNDWLRILLDGMRADIPASLRLLTERYRTREITEVEIRNYLRRGFAEINFISDENNISLHAKKAYKKYSNELNTNPAKALENLGSSGQEIILDSIDLIGG